MQFCGKAQKSLIRSQRSSATTCSLQKSEHMSTSRKNWVIRKQDLFYLLIPGNKQQKPYHSHIGITFFLKDLNKNKGSTLRNSTNFSAGNTRSRYKKRCPLKHSHLWIRQLEPSNKFRVPSICTLLSDWSQHSQGTHVCTYRGRSSAGVAHVSSGQVLGPCTPWPSCFAGSLLIQWTSRPPSQENVRFDSEGTGDRNPERSCKGKP